MAEFIYGNEINLELERMIQNAEEYLFFVSPYIKLHERLKAELKAKISDHSLQIVIVFGKNEGEVDKSVRKEDIDFFLQFPNIKICYEKNLHAKYYACEKVAILTSMNLHQFSQNTNIEAGIKMYPKNSIEQLANVLVSTQSIDKDADEYFKKIIEVSEIIYQSKPTYKKDFLGLTKKYLGPEIIFNRIAEFFKDKTQSTYSKLRVNSEDSVDSQPSYKQSQNKNYNQNTAFCIRTCKSIPYSISMPFCPEAFETWSQFNNPNYPEAFCHSTGRPSYGKTSMRNPVLRNSF